MTKEEIKEINDKCPYNQGIFVEPSMIPVHIKEPVIYCRYKTGGYSGGNCWNDDEPIGLVAKLDSAARFGWKVKLVYHQTFGWNWFYNRGETDHFITECQVIDKNPMKSVFGKDGGTQNGGRVVDTIYVVIVPKERLK